MEARCSRKRGRCGPFTSYRGPTASLALLLLHSSHAVLIRDLLYPRSDDTATLCARATRLQQSLHALHEREASQGRSPQRIARDDASALALATDVITNISTFSSGNLAMNTLMRNSAGSIAALDAPFPHVYLPLDDAGAADMMDVNASGVRVPLFLDDSIPNARFDATERLFQNVKYNDMTRFKWEVALRWIGKGATTLLTDPDIVYLRNPLHYLRSLPACDVITQAEVGALLMYSDRDSFTNALSLAAYSRDGSLLVNTGFMLFAPNKAAEDIIRLTMFAVDQVHARGQAIDDQTAFNQIIHDMYVIEGVTDVDKPSVTERYARFNRLHAQGGCLRLHARNTTTPHPGPATFTMYILSPLDFPVRPLWQCTDAHQRARIHPFLVHYNWAQPLARKQLLMQQSCHWDTALDAGS